MKDRSRTFAEYWRNSLADAALGCGSLSKNDLNAYTRLDKNILYEGRLPLPLTEKLFEEQLPSVDSLNVIVRPLLYQVKLEHGKQRNRGLPEFVAPILSKACLRRDGRLYPQACTVIPRDLLEPVEQGSFALGTMDDLDTYLTTYPFEAVTVFVEDEDDEQAVARYRQAWTKYLEACRRLLEKVGRGFSSDDTGFLPLDHGLLLPENQLSSPSHKHVLPLYDHLRESNPAVPLFDTYANETVSEPEPCLPKHAAFSARLAHSGNTFPLAEAQRDALAHLLVARHGDILAVNGPPGTGKTTMLLSVVATLWARAALAGGEPPVIVAASTNNQAVTNVIDAFGKDFAEGEGPLAGRWLPSVKSFGAYFPAIGKEGKQTEHYQTRAFFERVETSGYADQAEIDYLKAGRIAFPELGDADVGVLVARLRKELQGEADKLIALESAWAALAQARMAVQAELGENPVQTMAQRREQAAKLEAAVQRYAHLLQQWEAWRANESLFYGLFAWLPPVAAKRLRRARLFVHEHWPRENEESPIWTSLNHIESTVQTRLSDAKQAEHVQRQRILNAEFLQQAEQRALGRWKDALAVLNISSSAETLTLSEADALADTQIRFHAFRLATHYWEGRWLLEMRELDVEKERRSQGPKAMQRRWHRRMKLTPCVVSTFFMLPSLMAVKRHVADKDFRTDYLYDFADLLIVDEAGQVLPEVAGASFALARQALVIGDTLQIEPIWSVPSRVDVGNLISTGLINTDTYEQFYKRLSDLGKTAASGSVMRIAQQATRYHYDPNLARGMFLYEHRRCYDDIIRYCNRLCYHDKLIPRRGPKSVQSQWPALGYLHVDGICQQGHGGSRQNRLEADTLAAWLVSQKAELESIYNKPLADIIGVVTPFSGQVAAIAHACEKHGIAVGGKDGMTVGTVHSLQGAERPVVIFSAVYSKHADGGFIDRSPSMLNVAVSRAKDSFLVFGDMDVFELVPKSQPRGLLAHYLFARADNRLSFEYLPRPDLRGASHGLTVLRDAVEHDAFLLKLFDEACQEVHLVTPWINLDRIHEIGAMEAMRLAVQRGVRIHVYTDPGWVTKATDPEANAKQWQRLEKTRHALGQEGVELLFVHRVHSKSLTGDDTVYCNGSFNWFSASRHEQYVNHETSFAYRGPQMAHEIEALVESLRKRTKRFQQESNR